MHAFEKEKVEIMCLDSAVEVMHAQYKIMVIFTLRPIDVPVVAHLLKYATLFD